jgi:hypothetical protein
MPKDPQKFADLFGAKLVGEVPDVGGGPFGMARLAHIMHQRLTPGQGERPGRPTNPSWVTRCKVPMSEATLRQLHRMAEEMSTAERQVSPMQVAAQLLEEALGRVRAQTQADVGEVPHDPDGAASAGGAKARPSTAVGPGSPTGAEEGDVLEIQPAPKAPRGKPARRRKKA